MASVASQLIEEVTAHAQRDSLKDARGVCADGSYFPNNLTYIDCFVHASHLIHLKTKIDLNSIESFSPYRAVNTLRFSRKIQNNADNP